MPNATSRLRRPLLLLAGALTLVGSLIGVTAGPASASPSGMRFGAVVASQGRETFAAAIARQDIAYGTLPISRVFYSGAVQPWPGNAGASGRPVVISFKYAPSDVIAGKDDAALTQWFSTAPDYDVYWSYIHEPEDNIARGEFTSAAYKAAWTHIAGLAAPFAATNPYLHSTLIMMCYTMNPASHRDWHNYYVDSTVQSMVAFDCYNHAGKSGNYGDPATIFGPLTNWAAVNPGITWGVSEVGSTLSPKDPDGTLRARWLGDVGTFLVQQHQAADNAGVFGIYFDVKGPKGTDYRLTDANSQKAWRNVVQNDST